MKDLTKQFVEIRRQLGVELDDIENQLKVLSARRDALRFLLFNEKPKRSTGVTGGDPDPDFIREVVERRKRLGTSAIKVGSLAGFSRSYMSMLENGRFAPSEKAKAEIRRVLTDLEEEAKS